MALYAEKLVEFERSQVGTKEVPAGSNKVKYNTWFYGSEVSGDAYPWCCAFQNYCFNQVGFSSLFYGGKKTASCMTLEAYMKEKGLEVSKNDGRYGDTVFFNFGGSRTCHIGTIIKKNSDGSYETIEGNTSKSSNDNGGAVMIRTRYKNQISSICRPKYSLHKLVQITGSCHKFAKKDVNSKVLGKYTSNDKVRWVKDCGDGWSEIISLADGEVGYIKNKYLKKDGLSSFPVKTVITKGALRKAAKASSTALIKSVPVGTSVKLISKGKSYSNVIVDGKNGYFATKKIK